MRRFVLLSAKRSGSNLLCTLLGSHPDVLCHHEVFNPRGIFYALPLRDGSLDLGSMEERDEDPLGFLERVWDAHGGARAVGFKWTEGQDDVVLRHVLADPGCRKIVLRRRNRVKRFVSQRIAETTDQWELYRGEERERPPPRVEVTAAELRADVAAVAAFHDGLDRALADAPDDAVLRVEYERLFDPAEQRRMLAFLGVEESAAPLEATSVKQSPRDLRDAISNHDALAAELAGTDLAAELLDPGD